MCVTLCKRENSVTYPLKQALASITLQAEQRIIFEERYIHVIEDSYARCSEITFSFHLNRIIITIGSIIVPALISIQYDIACLTTLSQTVYWFTWAVSLCVTISNGLLSMFKFDKKYYLYHATYEQLKTEGWQYLALTGHYRAAGGNPNSHELQFHNFTQTIERILMREAEEQYIKLQDVNGNQKTKSDSNGIPNLIDNTKSLSIDDAIVRLAKALQVAPPTPGATAPAIPTRSRRLSQLRELALEANTVESPTEEVIPNLTDRPFLNGSSSQTESTIDIGGSFRP